MSKFQIIVGSMLGGTEYVAEACEEQLEKLDHDVNLHLKPDLASIFKSSFEGDPSSKIQQNKVWLICTSTHGAGDYPDNIQSFVDDLKKCEQDLSSINFMIIAIGDSSYDTFCKAGHELNKLLLTKGCNEITKIKTFDMSQEIDPEDLSQQWLIENKDLL